MSSVETSSSVNKELIAQLKSELGGKFKALVTAAMRVPAEYTARCLRGAMEGLGTSEGVLLEIICTRTPLELVTIKQAYERLFKRDLEEDITSETAGSYKRLMVSLLAGARDQSTTVDQAKAEKEAALLKKNVALWGRDESVLNQILAVRSPAQIRATLAEYEKLTGQDICVKLKRNLNSKLAAGYIAIVGCARNPARYYADQIHKAFAGIGMDEEKLIRIFVSRSEVDLTTIAELYPEVTEGTLREGVRAEATGDFRRGLYAIGGL
eukprot:m.219091 g.219091  ORF g.219091 m.219091 type:complete len:267 (+) comp17226_c0_seq26:403-1203(+)